MNAALLGALCAAAPSRVRGLYCGQPLDLSVLLVELRAAWVSFAARRTAPKRRRLGLQGQSLRKSKPPAAGATEHDGAVSASAAHVLLELVVLWKKM